MRAKNDGGFSGYSNVASATTLANQAPVARFTWKCNRSRKCDFNGSTSSDDGGVVSYAWEFGDGTTGSGVQVSRRYSSSGSRTVTLTVTDAEGLTNSASEVITVP